MRARLTVESGACEPAVVELTPGVTATIGRSRENSLVVRDDLVSRLHAKVFFEDDKWLIRDFGLNGTKVGGGKLVGAAELKDGMEIVIGLVKFRYAVGGLTASGLSPTVAAVSVHTPPPGPASVTPTPGRASEARATRAT